jgi:hypothetical protein
MRGDVPPHRAIGIYLRVQKWHGSFCVSWFMTRGAIFYEHGTDRLNEFRLREQCNGREAQPKNSHG